MKDFENMVREVLMELIAALAVEIGGEKSAQLMVKVLDIDEKVLRNPEEMKAMKALAALAGGSDEK